MFFFCILRFGSIQQTGLHRVKRLVIQGDRTTPVKQGHPGRSGEWELSDANYKTEEPI